MFREKFHDGVGRGFVWVAQNAQGVREGEGFLSVGEGARGARSDVRMIDSSRGGCRRG